MRIAACLLLLGACTTDSDPDVRIERQSATIANAKSDAWAEGGAVLVAAPGTFSFPQPLSLRISIVDNIVLDAEGAPTQLKIETASLGEFESVATLETVSAPTCAQNFCTAELEVTSAGASLLTVSAKGPEGDQKDCFYFGVYEGDAASGETYRADLEAKQADCRAMYWR